MVHQELPDETSAEYEGPMELNVKLEVLEAEKNETERTLYAMRKLYDDKTAQMEKVSAILQDEKETTYADMKDLLVIENEHAESLQKKVNALSRKRRSAKVFIRYTAFFLVIVAISSWYWFFLSEKDMTGLNPLSVICAAAKPGTRVEASSGIFEAPWWSPHPTKRHAFHLLCGNRPRVSLRIHDHMLIITRLIPEKPKSYVIVRQAGDVAQVEIDRLVITTKQGGRAVIAAPWNLDASMYPRLVAKEWIQTQVERLLRLLRLGAQTVLFRAGQIGSFIRASTRQESNQLVVPVCKE